MDLSATSRGPDTGMALVENQSEFSTCSCRQVTKPVPDENWYLCPDCRTLIRQFGYELERRINEDPYLGPGPRISMGSKVIEDSAAAGCRLCKMFVASMSKDKTRDWGRFRALNDTATLRGDTNAEYIFLLGRGYAALGLNYKWISKDRSLYTNLTFTPTRGAFSSFSND
jgi:hypothetical protein